MERGIYIADIENTIAAIGNTVETLLKQLPGVRVYRDGISVNGKTVTVYVDNIQINLQGEQLMSYLQALRSEDVSKVEIQPYASAEFSAEGEGGVLRIITKRRATGGWQVDMLTNVSYREYVNYAPSLAFRYSNDKLGAWISFGKTMTKQVYQVKEVSEVTETAGDSETNYDMRGTREGDGEVYSGTANLSYDFNSRHKLAFHSFYLFSHHLVDANQHTAISGDLPTEAITSTYDKLQIEHVIHSCGATINYDFLLDSLGKNKITWLADYTGRPKYTRVDTLHYLNKNERGDTISNESFENDQQGPYHIYSSEIRYNHDFGEKRGRGLLGVKYGYTQFKNSLDNYTRNEDVWERQPEMGYDYQYGEHLVAAFYRYDLSRESWSLTAGLRGEYTDGQVQNGETSIKGLRYNRFNLFPSCNYSYTLNSQNTLSLSYTRRIRRINYLHLLPTRVTFSRYMLIEGNPKLKPNLLNTIGVNYGIKGKYYISADYGWSDNVVSDYSEIRQMGDRLMVVSTWRDGARQQEYRVRGYVPITFSSWWSCITQTRAHLNNYQAPEVRAFSSFHYSFYTQHDFSLPFDIRAQVEYQYQPKTTIVYITFAPYHWTRIAVQKSLCKNKSLTLKMEVNDLITNKFNNKEKTAQVVTKSRMYERNPFFQLTISYKLNGGKVKEVREVQRSNEEERSRAN
jgi:hypothetical protein